MSLFMHIYICKNKLINFLFSFKQIRRRYMYRINVVAVLFSLYYFIAYWQIFNIDLFCST